MKKNHILWVVFLLCNGLYGNDSLESFEKIFLQKNHDEKLQLFLSMLKEARICYSSFEVLDKALCDISIEGLYLEMGVFEGRSINYIASKKKEEFIYGFDSFEGLPENWTRDDTEMFIKGFFAIGQPPVVAKNVKLYKGWFQDSLPLFKQNFLKNQPIAFMHIDCDIYSSTKTIFDTLGDNICIGTIIVFDEFYRYLGFEKHEFKAFYEFLKLKNYKVQYLAYNINHEQVAVKIVV